MSSYAQTPCSDTQADIGYAYSHAKTAYEANNLTQLKRFASRSLEAFRRAEKVLKDCQCQDAYYEAFDAIVALDKIADIDVYDDARFFIKRARDYAKQTIAELEICTKWSSEDHALAELEDEQQKLEEQRKLLQQKEERIKMQLADKIEKEKMLKKEKLITQNQAALSNSIESFNQLLRACGCNSVISQVNMNKDNLIVNSIDTIKTTYLNKVREVTSSYMSALNLCNIR
jgi:hypothetical protein